MSEFHATVIFIADARFINLQLSTLTDKWYGESQKLAAAVFTLAEKIQPAIIFIDEIGKFVQRSFEKPQESFMLSSHPIAIILFFADAFLRVRDRGDHEVTAMMKAQFLSLWDGLISSQSSRIVILGATNVCRVFMPRRSHLTVTGLQRPQDVDDAIKRRLPCTFCIGFPVWLDMSSLLVDLHSLFGRAFCSDAQSWKKYYGGNR